MALGSDGTVPTRVSQDALRTKSKDPRSGAVASRPVVQSAQAAAQAGSNTLVYLLSGLIGGLVSAGVAMAVLNAHAPTVDLDADSTKVQVEAQAKNLHVLEDSLTKVSARQMKLETEMERQGRVLDEIKQYIHDKR